MFTSFSFKNSIAVYGKFEPSRAWMKGVEPALYNRASISHWKLYILKNYVQDFCKSGRKFPMGTIFGASIVYGSVTLWPRISYAMDGFDVLVYDHDADLLGVSDREEDPHAMLAFSRKMWLPVFLFLTVLLNWNHPVVLAAKVFFFLLSTKPRPFSVYLFVEKLRRRSMSQQPLFYKFNSLYASKVEVEDYAFLCLARVELKGQKFTLIGILGSWWVLPLSPSEGEFSVFGNINLKNYSRL
ncbi:uncharacterized protein LOC132284394 isoform X2 [Cornus florida]|uniref:uncharacterized protein LOC132284394 isoform X2 n=1 Tax=Cornus florida TaxID=4283 RepID=UPI0028977689|nr:uncharacterized protein LOC132284394 isoform X2 [Cornus florida]